MSNGFPSPILRALGLTTLSMAAAFAPARTEPGSFLDRPVKTTADLLAQIEKNPRVRSRFTRHFGMTTYQVKQMFKTLTPGTLKKDGLFVIYNVHEDEMIRSRLFRLKKGTRVFFDRKGRATLKFSCANPMIGGSDHVTATSNPEVIPSSAVIPDMEESSAMVEAPDLAAVAMVPEIETLPVVETIGVASPAESVLIESASPARIPSLGGGFNVLPFLLTGGGGILFAGKGGGGGNPAPPPPVPEPATLLALATGSALLARRIRRGRNR